MLNLNFMIFIEKTSKENTYRFISFETVDDGPGYTPYRCVNDIAEFEFSDGKMNMTNDYLSTYKDAYFADTHDNVDFGKAKKVSAKILKICEYLAKQGEKV